MLHLSEGVPISHNLKQVIVFNNHQNTHLLNSMESLMNEVLTKKSKQKDMNVESQIKNKFGNLILGFLLPPTTHYRIVSEQNDNN